ncbi:hypothetical protein FRC17_003691 [Serendipita sp. 399]|nr:hypothetical protein FRC17_003691 [Serendipita sp. 399]
MFRISCAARQNLHSIRRTRAWTSLLTTPNAHFLSTRKVSTEVKSESGPSPPDSKAKRAVLLEYKGPLTETYHKLKIFSLTSLGLAVAMTPLMFYIDSAVSTGGRAILGLTAMSTSGLSTALVSWAGKSYVTQLMVEEPGPRLKFTTTNLFLRERITTVYDPLFLEPAEEYLTKVRLRKSVRIPMKEVERLGMRLSDGMEETVAETADSNGEVQVRVKVDSEDTVEILKKMIAAQMGTDWQKIELKKWYTTYKNHITLADYEIHDGMSLEMYYS